MKAAILSIGNEIVSGQTMDTNCVYLSLGLKQAGFAVTEHSAVPDETAPIISALSGAAKRVDLVLVTGGLGPTADDVTREALSEFLGRQLVVNREWTEALQRRYAPPGQQLPERFLSQATVPDGTSMLQNEIGTACGFVAQQPCRIAVLPGVPSEMKRMFDAHLLPLLAEEGGGVVRSRSVNVFGLWESEIDDLLSGMIDPAGNPSVGVTAQGAVVKVRAELQAANSGEADAVLGDFEREVRTRLGDNVFGTDSDTLESAVGQALIGKGLTLSLAESCTGGLIGHRLTNVAGISESLLMGVIAYRDEVKTGLLGVPEGVIAARGAVSEEVALAMASGVRRVGRSDFGLSATGIAGPTGGSPGKPVGTVFIGLDGPDGTTVRRHRFSGDRQDIKEKTANSALDLLRRALVGSGSGW